MVNELRHLCIKIVKITLNEQGKYTYETTTSFFACATNRFPPSFRPNSTPIALGLAEVVSNRIFVTVACMATVKFFLARTSGVKYADSEDTRLKVLST